MTPQVDVVVPVRNGGKLLRPAVDSVLSQTGVDVRVWVVDDGSTDGAVSRLPRDRRVLVAMNSGRGTPDAINTGIALGSAPYVAIQDADDLSLPGRLAASTAHLEAEPGIGVVATGFEVLVGRKVVAEVRTLPRNVLERNPICHGTVTMRRSVIEQVGGYRSQFRCSQDYDTWLRCAEVSGITILPVIGYRYRVWAGQVTIRNPGVQRAWADLARESAAARRAGLPDPADPDPAAAAAAAIEHEIGIAAHMPRFHRNVGPERDAEADEVQAWWAREFAALGSWPDALRCLRRLPARRAVSELVRLRGPLEPQVVWS